MKARLRPGLAERQTQKNPHNGGL